MTDRSSESPVTADPPEPPPSEDSGATPAELVDAMEKRVFSEEGNPAAAAQSQPPGEEPTADESSVEESTPDESPVEEPAESPVEEPADEPAAPALTAEPPPTQEPSA